MATQADGCRISLEDASDVLGDFRDEIVEDFMNAWDTWLRVGQAVPQVAVAADKRARGSTVWCLIKNNIERRFQSNPRIKFFEVDDLWLVRVDDAFLFRVKKTDKRDRVWNRETGRQKQCDLQDPALVDTDLPLLVMTYRLDRAETRIEDIRLWYRRDKTLYWICSLLSAAAFEQPSIPFANEEQPLRRDRVRSQSGAKKQKPTSDEVVDHE